MQLPFEVLAIVFAQLPPKDLDNVKFVCRSWREVASDRVWKQRFAQHYGTTDVTRVVSASSQWRHEFLTRQAVLLKWRRCVKETDVTLNSTLSDVSNIFPNFSTDTPRTTCFNTHSGMGNMWDLDRGKMRRRVYASKYSHQLLPIASIDGSRFGLVYGFYNGEVATVSFTRDGTVVADYVDLPYRHETAVSALWIAKQRQLTKASKRPDDAAVVASGSTDGTVYLMRPGLHLEFRLSQGCIVLLEGTMYGTYVKNDGSIIACLDISGRLFLLSFTAPPRRLLAHLPFTLDTAQTGIELHMANDYVIVQTATAIYVVDIHTGTVNVLSPPPDHRICTFGIDKSYVPGPKYIAAGFSNNDISVWALPAPLPTSIVRTDRQSESPEPETASTRSLLDTAAAAAAAAAERELQTSPLWTLPNPIGYDHRLDASGKPQITQLALNAAVLLVAGYNGVVTAMDVLSGQTLKRVSSRISKNVLDLMLYSRDGFVPVTHLEIDPNPLHFRAIIVTRPAVQYLDLGPLDTKKTSRKHLGQRSKQQRAGTPHVSSASRQDLAEEISLRREFAELDAERESEQQALREAYSMNALDEDEQLEYAMMLSEQAAATRAAARDAASVSASASATARDTARDTGLNDLADEADEEEQLRRAIELSAAGDENADIYSYPDTPASDEAREPAIRRSSASDEYNYDGEEDEDGDDDEQLRRAIELSTLEAQTAGSEAAPQPPAADASNVNEQEIDDEDLRRALELSLILQ